MTEQKGFRFLHASWRDSRFSLAEIKSLPHEQTAQEFVITRVTKLLVWYRPVYRHGDREDLGAAFVCNRGELARHILQPSDR